MMKSALGMVEVTGLALAITVADVMAKSANIKIEGLERVNGFGWVLVQVSGDVGSVNAAVNSGAEFARTQQGLMASKVIARPVDALGALWNKPQKLKVLEPKAAAIEAKQEGKNQSSKTASTTTSAEKKPAKAAPTSRSSSRKIEAKEGIEA